MPWKYKTAMPKREMRCVLCEMLVTGMQGVPECKTYEAEGYAESVRRRRRMCRWRRFSWRRGVKSG